MRISPLFPTIILKKPYHIGIKTGFLLGFGMAWIIQNLLHSGNDLIVAIVVFIIGSMEYIKEIKDGYDFIEPNK